MVSLLMPPETLVVFRGQRWLSCCHAQPKSRFSCGARPRPEIISFLGRQSRSLNLRPLSKLSAESPSVIRAPAPTRSANYLSKLTKLSDRAFGAPQTMHNLLAPRVAVTNGTYATCILLPPWQLRCNAAFVCLNAPDVFILQCSKCIHNF